MSVLAPKGCVLFHKTTFDEDLKIMRSENEKHQTRLAGHKCPLAPEGGNLLEID